DHLGKFDTKADDGYFLGYAFNSKAFRFLNTIRQQIEETYHVTSDKKKHVPEVIDLNEPNISHTKDAEGPSGKNTKVLVSIIESLVPDVSQSHISHQASISSHLVPQDIWSNEQHIELVNIIGDHDEGMLTRSMATKLIASSASECLFVDFLFEIEPKKVSEALKHP
nr:retrovirus-related Pol polyprotein from transposon TNT 1-94 [Tanacetum cinerariifolium]